MCTASWCSHTHTGQELEFHLWFNRDELLSRTIGLPPQHSLHNGRNILTPMDTQAGGTWLGVNSEGLILCLLNYYPVPPNHLTKGKNFKEPVNDYKKNTYKSRGKLIPQLLTHSKSLLAEPTEMAEMLESLDEYPPFTLLCFRLMSQEKVANKKTKKHTKLNLGESIISIISGLRSRLIRWDGKQLFVGAVPPVVTSSSYCPQKIEPLRIQHFYSLQQKYLSQFINQSEASYHARIRLHNHYHCSHQPRFPSNTPSENLPSHNTKNGLKNGFPSSICMHRNTTEQAGQTVSLCYMSLKGNTMHIKYQEGAPCENKPSHYSSLIINPILQQ